MTMLLDPAAKDLSALLSRAALHGANAQSAALAAAARAEATHLVSGMTPERREKLADAIYNYVSQAGLDGADEAHWYGVAHFLSDAAEPPAPDAGATTSAIESDAAMTSPGDVVAQADGNVMLSYPIFSGRGAVPTSFVRTAAFADTTVGLKIFEVLGMKKVAIERGEKPLNLTHLKVLIYLSSMVKSYDAVLGANVTFNPRTVLKALGWSNNNISLRRLHDAVEALAGTTIRIREDGVFDVEEAASLVGRRVTSLAKSEDGERADWQVQILATLLNALRRFRTFVDFRTLAVLPNGAASHLYMLLMSEAIRETEWPVARLAEIAGLTSRSRSHVKAKLTEALEVLVCGEVRKSARGKAVHAEGKGVAMGTNRKGKQVFRSTSLQTLGFPPLVKEFSFRTDSRGQERVKIVLAGQARRPDCGPADEVSSRG